MFLDNVMCPQAGYSGLGASPWAAEPNANEFSTTKHTLRLLERIVRHNALLITLACLRGLWPRGVGRYTSRPSEIPHRKHAECAMTTHIDHRGYPRSSAPSGARPCSSRSWSASAGAAARGTSPRSPGPAQQPESSRSRRGTGSRAVHQDTSWQQQNRKICSKTLFNFKRCPLRSMESSFNSRPAVRPPICLPPVR